MRLTKIDPIKKRIIGYKGKINRLPADKSNIPKKEGTKKRIGGINSSSGVLKKRSVNAHT